MVQTYLMILERGKTIIPVSENIFKVTQSSDRTLKEYYNNALVISREGKVFPIERINVAGWFGTTRWEKFISALSGTKAITVQFGQEKAMDLEEIKELIVEYLGYDQQQADPYLPQSETLETIFQSIQSASNMEEIFKNIYFPESQDCLDVL